MLMWETGVREQVNLCPKTGCSKMLDKQVYNRDRKSRPVENIPEPMQKTAPLPNIMLSRLSATLEVCALLQPPAHTTKILAASRFWYQC